MSEPTLASGAAADVSGGGETTETSGQSFGGQQSQQTEPGNGINPAWNPVLEKLPPEFHNMITPNLREWDQNFQNKIQEVQSRYAPYQELVDNEIPVDTIQAALQLAAVIEADPQGFYNQLGDFYKDQWGQGQDNSSSDDTFELGGAENQPEFDIMQHPKVQELMQNQQVMAQFLSEQIQQQENAKADAALKAEEEALVQEFGDFDPQWVYPYAVQQGVDLKTAVQAYQSFVNQIRQTPTASSTAPTVMAPSGTIPSSQPNPANLSGRETRSLVAEILAKANQEG